jgi:hypothetical protein
MTPRENGRMSENDGRTPTDRDEAAEIGNDKTPPLTARSPIRKSHNFCIRQLL